MSDNKSLNPNERLRSAREGAGYPSAAEAARAHGWSEASYRHHENGTRGFPIKQALAYGRAFKVSPSWLVGWSAEPERAIIEDFRDKLLGIDITRTGKEVSDELAEKYRVSFINRMNLSTLVQSDGIVGINHDDFYIFDSSMLHGLSSSSDPYFMALVVDVPVEADGIEQGALILVDRTSTSITRQNMLWIYSYNGIAGISRLWAHPDGTFELLDSGNVKLTAAQVTIWGQAVWVGKQL